MAKPFIPYFETSRYKVDLMVKMCGNTKNKRVADLGSGDGRIAIAFGKKGAFVTGFELDSGLVLKSREFIRKEKLEKRVEIKQEDFWDADLSNFDIVVVYPMPDIMKELGIKLQKELIKGSCIVTNYYVFPGLHPVEQRNNIFKFIV